MAISRNDSILATRGRALLEEELAKRASDAIDRGNFSELAAILTSTFSDDPVCIPARHQLVNLCLPYRERPEVGRALTSLIAIFPEGDAIRAKVLRSIKTGSPTALMALIRNVSETLESRQTSEAERGTASLEIPADLGEVGPRTLVVITDRVPKSSVDAIADLVGRGCQIYVAASGYVKALPSHIFGARRHAVAFTETLGEEVDSRASEEADQLARAIVADMRQSQHANERKLADDFHDALHARYADIVAPDVRQQTEIAALRERIQAENCIIVGSETDASALTVSGPLDGLEAARLVADRLELHIGSFTSEEISALAKRPIVFDAYTPKRPSPDAPYSIAVLNLVDGQTFGASEQILPALEPRTDILLFPAPSNLSAVQRFRPEFAGSRTQDILDSPRVRLPKAPKRGKRPSLLSESGVVERVALRLKRGTFGWTRHARKLARPEDARIDQVMSANRYALLRSLTAIKTAIEHLAHLAKVWARPVAEARSILVSPGRHLEALALVTMAKKAGVPSFELQNGTISAYGRYPKPLAETVLAFEAFSSDVYEKLGVERERIRVVGSPRLDGVMDRVSQLDRDQARDRLLGSAHGNAKLVLFASQPLATETQKSLFRMLAESVANLPDDTVLVLQPHPREGEDIKAWYEAEALRNGLGNGRFVQSTNLPDALVASDIVVTYFSTVGLEALQLGRRTIVVSEKGAVLPYDLTRLGALGPATNTEELSRLLTQDANPDRNGAQGIPRDAASTIAAMLTGDGIS